MLRRDPDLRRTLSRFIPWALVALCFALGVAGRSVGDAFTVFVPALQSSFGASRSAITLVYSFLLLVMGAGAPIAGLIVDRFGLRMLTVSGMSAIVLALLSASWASEVWHLYLGLGIVLGFGISSIGGVANSTILRHWFPAARLGVPLAVAWSASGVGGIVVLPLAQYLIAAEGWEHTYRFFALVAAAFIPVLLVLPWRLIAGGASELAHARTAGGAGPSVGEALRERSFWTLSVSFAATSLGTYSVAPQAMAYLLERGLNGPYAARALAVAGFLTPPGMVGFSWLADRGGRKLAALLAYGASILGVCALGLVRSPTDGLWLWLYVMLFGCSMGSRAPMISTLATLRYHGAHFGRIYGLISAGMGVGGFLGAWIGGLLHDWTQGYAAVMIFAIASFVLATALLGAEASERDRLSRDSPAGSKASV
jgi:MFS family permease